MVASTVIVAVLNFSVLPLEDQQKGERMFFTCVIDEGLWKGVQRADTKEVFI
jgi:hypothetical protein